MYRTLLATALWSATAAAAASPELLAAVKKAQGQAYLAAGHLNGSNTKKEGDKVVQIANACVAAVDAALAGGADAGDLVQVDGKVEGAVKEKNALGYPVSMAPLSSVRAFCEGITGHARAKDMSSSLALYDGWLQKLSNPKHNSPAEMNAGYLQVPKCEKAVDEALAASPPTTVVRLKKSTVTLGEAKVKICQALQQQCDSMKAAFAAAREAKIAPFRAVLKGDRMKVFEAQDMAFESIYGPGGRQLHTPEEFAAAPTWYVVLSSDDGVFYRWTTRGFRFRGNNSAGPPVEKNGIGRNPPSAAYP
jgi:hypothetical protein